MKGVCMKLFIKKLCFFLALLLVLDFGVGKVFDILRVNAKNGSTYQNEFIANECAPDILILGSSRASHHYAPDVITENLGQSCYNAGKDGCGIILEYVRFSMITERKKTRIVIYDVVPKFDYLVEDADDYSKYISQLKPYYNKATVQEVMQIVSTPENNFLSKVSSLYRYNSRVVPLVADSIIDRKEVEPNGFSPLSGVMETTEKETLSTSENKVDATKWAFLEKLIQDCEKNGITLIFVVSPEYCGELSEEYSPIQELAGKYNIPFWNYIGYAEISKNNTLFQDRTHMNKDGAAKYSEIIADELKKYIRQ